MLHLPDTVRAVSHLRRETLMTHGINYSDNLADGDLTDCRGVSLRRYPGICTRAERRKVTDSVAALTVYDGNLIYISTDGTLKKQDGTVLATLTARNTPRQFAVVNSKLVILPDLVVYDFAAETLLPMKYTVNGRGLTIAVTDGDVVLTPQTFSLTGNVSIAGATLTVTANTAPGAVFAVGDMLTVDDKTGRIASINGNDVTLEDSLETEGTMTNVTLTATGIDISTLIAGDTITVTGFGDDIDAHLSLLTYLGGGVFRCGTATALSAVLDAAASIPTAGAKTITHSVPDLDFICESDNRLWGCSTATKTIYASALGDPRNFDVFEGASTDAYAVAVGSGGAFTGCCRYGSSVLFFKEDKIHKLLGSYPAEYYVYTYDVDGVKAGCHRSLVPAGEVLYYMGPGGVMRYAGGLPAPIGETLGRREYKDAVGGTDGASYFLSAKDAADGFYKLFRLDLARGIWLCEDVIAVSAFARIGAEVYFVDEYGDVYLEDATDGDEGRVEWFFKLAPFYESINGRRHYSRIVMRVELEAGAWITAEVRTDDGIWQEAQQIRGQGERSVTMRVVPTRCEKFELRLTGCGNVRVFGLTREWIPLGE